MAIRIVRLGTPRAKGEGVRLGTVRRPPRGVKKTDYARLDYYDAWLPELAPSPELVRWMLTQKAVTPAVWQRFEKGYRRQMKAPERERLLAALALLSHVAPFSVGCYCEDYARCHRSILEALLRERGARIERDD